MRIGETSGKEEKRDDVEKKYNLSVNNVRFNSCMF